MTVYELKEKAKSTSCSDADTDHLTSEEQKQSFSPSQSASSHVQFDIVGDVYVDLLCYLPSSSSSLLSLDGSDSALQQPISIMAGGSTLNTATYLQYLQKHLPKPLSSSKDRPINVSSLDVGYEITVHSMFNPNDHYGSILVQHAAKYNVHLRNGFPGNPTNDAVDTNSEVLQSSSSTPHCIVLISSHPSSTERTFLTHRGCATKMTIHHLFPCNPNDAANDAVNPGTARHVHIAGFFCTPGFWSPEDSADGSLPSSNTLLSFVLDLYRKPRLNAPTILSLVTQCDASQTWDMTVLISILPYVHICIMNEHEALQMFRKNHSRGCSTDSTPDDTAIMSFLTPFNPSTIFIITKGIKGAVAYRHGVLVASVIHTVNIHAVVTGSMEPLIDPTGAGDAFCAGLFHAMWQTIGPMHPSPAASFPESAPSCYRPSDHYWPSPEQIQSALIFGCTVGTCAVSQRGASVPPTDPSLIREVQEQYLAMNTNMSG